MNGAVAWWVRPLHTISRPAAALGRGRGEDAFAGLLRRAARQAGSTEPPDPQFAADLRFLYDSFAAAGELSFLGLSSIRHEVTRHLANWLRVRDLIRAHPQIASAPVRSPVFVTGLPRTGTTLLHSLLADVPAHRAPLMWELLDPCPPAAGRTASDTRQRRARRLASAAQYLAPSLRVIHPLDASGPEECVLALPQSMYVHTRARLPGYRAWFEQRDATPDYLYLRQQLQVLQWRQPQRRWILKTPFHLWSLDALLRVFGDATIVWTHRDPHVAIASWCSLMEVTMGMSNQRVDLRLLGQDWTGMWASAVTQAMAVRERSPQSFIDVPYDRLTSSPAAAVSDVLARLGPGPALAAGGQARGRDSKAHGQHARQRPGAHRYSLARYSLTAESVSRAFSGYLRATTS